MCCKHFFDIGKLNGILPCDLNSCGCRYKSWTSCSFEAHSTCFHMPACDCTFLLVSWADAPHTHAHTLRTNFQLFPNGRIDWMHIMHEQALITSACVRIRINIINSLCISHVWVCAQRELHWTPWVEFVPNGTYLLLSSPATDKHSKHLRLLNWVDTILWSILTSIHIKIVSSHTVTPTHFIAPFHSIDSFLINAANVFVVMGMQLTVASNKMLASFLAIYLYGCSGTGYCAPWPLVMNDDKPSAQHELVTLHMAWSAQKCEEIAESESTLWAVAQTVQSSQWALISYVRTISPKCR